MATSPADGTATTSLATPADFAVGSAPSVRLLHPGAAPATPARRGRARRAGTAPGRDDEVSRARAKKKQMLDAVDRFVEHRLASMESAEVYSVPRLYTLLTGGLAAASALRVIEAWSEGQFQRNGSAWVYASTSQWTNRSGLSDEEWIAARQVLREFGLIRERRRYHLELSEIVTEIAFDPEAFAREVADIRGQLRDLALSQVRNGEALGGAQP